MNLDFTEKRKLDFGIEIVAGFHASKYGGDMEMGRIDALANTSPDRMEGYTQEWWDGLEDDARVRFVRMCEIEKDLLHKQALILANVALAYLNKLGY